MDVSPAPASIADVVDSRRLAKLPLAKDMSHHVNRITKNRQPNSLKEMYKYMQMPGMISLAGGIPSPELFPFESLSASVLRYDHLPLDPPRVPKSKSSGLLSWLFGGVKHLTFSIPKYAEDPTDPMAIQLATSLQYGQATGPPAFPVWLRNYVETVFRPAYADWDVLLDVGATDGFGKAFNMLLEMGDSILIEEWSYPGAMNAYMPFEVNVVPLKMDGQGVLPEYMDEVLANWDEGKQGKRPRVFYTVPTGQNPTGATMLAERKKAVYAVASKYDIVIVEDEPYYCLFSGEYIPQHRKPTPLAQRQLDLEKMEGKEGNEAFLKALPPTYLTVDTDGRVIRLDTFSKTSCPGSRLGWITTSPIFIERLTRLSEASTQAPSGFASAMTISLLNTWGWDGYVRWLRGIKARYRMRRDWVCDALADTFHLEFDDEDGSQNALVMDIPGIGRGITGYAKHAPGSSEARWDEKRGVASSPHGPPLVSFIPPTAGMFIFLGVHLEHHPEYHALGDDATRILVQRLWKHLADHLVLFAPGIGFDANGVHNIGGKGVGYFRLSYSILTYEQTRSAMDTFAKVLAKFLRQQE